MKLHIENLTEKTETIQKQKDEMELEFETTKKQAAELKTKLKSLEKVQVEYR